MGPWLTRPGVSHLRYFIYLFQIFISILYIHIAINLEDIDKTYANKD